LGEANQEGLDSIIPGLLGGAVAGGVFTAWARKIHQNREAKDYIVSIDNTVPDHLKNLTPPKMTWANRLSAMFLQKQSADPLLANFREVDDHLLRGAMPESGAAFHRLKNEHNVVTLIDLRGLETTKPEHIEFEHAWAKEKGIKHVWLPMDSHQAPTQEILQRLFLEAEKARRAGGKVYVHCKHGIDRTGSVVAAYETALGKTKAEVYESMQANGYNFLHARNRPNQKAFVLGDEMPEMVYKAQCGVVASLDGERLLAQKRISESEFDQLSQWLDEGRLPEAEAFLAEKMPGRPPIYVEKAVFEKSPDGDQFVKAPSSKPPVVSPPPFHSSDPLSGLGSKKKPPVQGTQKKKKVSTAGVKRLSVQDLFGSDLRAIRFNQNYGNTCYLLSALDNIFAHPQGHHILNQIQFEKTVEGYNVKFPGQPHKISVRESELHGTGVISRTKGVQLLEAAYLKIPGVRPGEYDNTSVALRHMFGNRLSHPDAIGDGPDIFESSQMSALVDDYADIWTATRKTVTPTGRLGAGEHYYSLRLNPRRPNEIRVVNPFDTSEPTRTYNSIDALDRDFHVELNRINLH
jgi:hypothetical protein